MFLFFLGTETDFETRKFRTKKHQERTTTDEKHQVHQVDLFSCLRCQRLVLDTFSANKNSGEFPAEILKASKLEEAIQNEERTNGGDARELRFVEFTDVSCG